MPYDYLIQSIIDFYSQKDLLDIIEQNKFIKANVPNKWNCCYSYRLENIMMGRFILLI